ncbi:CBS domain-containing protein [Streptomyces sp. NPDC054794]
MVQRVRDVMADVPVTVQVQVQDTVASVARLMRDTGVGVVLVTEGDQLRGLVSDRDLVVRAIADGTDPEHTTVA